MDERSPRQFDGSEIAIVGMACRFPGANTPETFWRNLSGGVESLTRLSDEELARAGVDPRAASESDYVRRSPVIDGIEDFDARFFGYTPLEAKVMDPQHRLFLECAWEAFEDAGYNPDSLSGATGVFTGAKTNTYLRNLVSNQDLFRSLDTFQIALGNDLACMATRVSYKLDLRGPSYAVHTACSTSLVAVHLACQSLLLDECQLALAGGAAVNVPQRRGYRYQKGGILSPDGSCRTFDARAEGSNFGNGAGAVLLKRLEDAIADGDTIRALILGSATNNDGALKASFTAPGAEGQTGVVLEAMACAGIEADSLSYVEAHGTATDLGDSIEMMALNEAFRASTRRRGFCAVGSVKTNIGHLETAAGIAGLIKTALALEQRQIPPSLHFEAPNPKIDFANSPFYVNTELSPWSTDDGPRRAGVSSFGIGSTNAHAVLEEAPPSPPASPSRPQQLLLLSARTETALEATTENLATHLEHGPELDLADVAYTLQVGRKAFRHRRFVVCQDRADAIRALRDDQRSLTHKVEQSDRQVVFLLPGLGDQSLEMAIDLYRSEPVFRAQLERCAQLLEDELGLDLRTLLYPRGTEARPTSEPQSGKIDLRRMLGRAPQEDSGTADAPDAPGTDDDARLDRTRFSQPVMFAVEYALAQQWAAWGVRPQALLGYSLGEYVAACLAGVLSLEDALTLVAGRARLIEALPAGAMLAVPLSEEEVTPLAVAHGLSLAAINGPSVCVVAGPVEGIEALEQKLADSGVVCRRLRTSHAFHSQAMQPIVGDLTQLASTLDLKPPEIPYLSNVTGTWMTAEDATDPAYWARHLCNPVRFAEATEALLRDAARVWVELGTGQSLASFVKQHPACDAETARLVMPSLPGAYNQRTDIEQMLATAGILWQAGVAVDWHGLHAGQRQRVPLPTYPFERSRHWVEPDAEFGTTTPTVAAPKSGDAPNAESNAGRRVTLDKQPDVGDWFYRPVWRRQPLAEVPVASSEAACWLLLADDRGLAAQLTRHLKDQGHDVVQVVPGAGFACVADGRLTVDPSRAEDYAALLEEVSRRPLQLGGVLHLWGAEPVSDDLEHVQDIGFFSLLFLAQAFGKRGLPDHLPIAVVTSGVQKVIDGDTVEPEKATVLGPCRVIPQELAGLDCRAIDVELPSSGRFEDSALADQILTELRVDGDEAMVAYRDNERWQQDFEKLRLEPISSPPTRLRQQGVYLITGGLGGLGLVLANHLAETVQARLVLIGRSAMPPSEAWSEWLQEQGEDDPISIKIRQLQAMEEAGSEVMAIAADVTDADQLGSVVAAATERFGALHGVIHLAGIPGGGIIQLKTRQQAERIMGPKVAGVRALETVLRDRQVDFLVLFSSIASILGEFGQADYCGANAYLDAVAQRNLETGGPPTLTLNWDIWCEVGLAVDTEVPANLQAWREEMLEQAILSHEGVDAFDRALGCLADVPSTDGALAQVVISAQELQGRIELGKAFTGENFLRELEKAQSTVAPQTHRTAVAAPTGGSLVQRLAEIWRRILGVEELSLEDNFFDLGGNSLLGLQLVSEIGRELGLEVAPVTLFESPTVASLARQLDVGNDESANEEAPRRSRRQGDDIAIIGLTGRFPGARDVDELWQNLRHGVESLTFFSDDELVAAGVSPAALEDSAYVKVGAVLEDVDRFDATLFGYSPREAEIMDPQHRVFLECAWEALERSGYDPQIYDGSIGVFAGSNLSTYLLQLYSDPSIKASVNLLQAVLGNDKDSLTTSVSYKLNLKGPSIAVQTFCSTSLVAVHMACRSLIDGDCDMALAGGIRIVVPMRQGYLWEQGGIAPHDGHSRPFDAKADGSILGNGAGIVVLKPLDAALADGDHIHAVIKGTAINNDGSLKAGYTAPSVAGQTEVVLDALDRAGCSPEDLSYIEAHGSATELGDPIEVSALTQAFRRHTSNRRFCAIGSVKSNFGHLDRAAGVTGLIKTALALEHEEIPPSINFEEPNPNIDFEHGPFFVNEQLRPWTSNGTPRRAGVNSLGIGGTNVHVVVEEAPTRDASSASRPWQLLLLSAKSENALDAASERLADHLGTHKQYDLEGELADVAFTLQVGRRSLPWRRAVVCKDPADAVTVLRNEQPERLLGGFHDGAETPVVFLFPGLGGQYVGMTRGLYDSEPVFRTEIDHGAELLEPYLEVDIRELLYPSEKPAEPKAAPGGIDLRRMLGRGDGSNGAGASDKFHETRISQPLLFIVEYALARMWMSWGFRPEAVLGYSLGEYVAACLAGVMSFEDALDLVVTRARMIHEVPAGAMLALPLSEQNVAPWLDEQVSLAALNGPEQSVVAGPVAAIEALEKRLAEAEVSCRRLTTTHAFHSAMMRPLYDQLVAHLDEVRLNAPEIPYLSNVTGTWITPEQATDKTYWARHMCQPVRFSDSIGELLEQPERLFLEIGPGQTLGSLILQHPAVKDRPVPLTAAVLPHAYERQPDTAHQLSTLGKLWLAGARPDWQGFYAEETRRRKILPTYPFERQRYWLGGIDQGAQAFDEVSRRQSATHPSDSSQGQPGSTVADDDAPQKGMSRYPRPHLKSAYVAPKDEVEQQIADIWSDLLGIGEIGIHDNFLELGGDSLLATRLVSRMRDAFELDLPVRLFFEASTIAELARAIHELRTEVEEQEMLELLAQVEQMSEDELSQEIEKRQSLA